MKKETNNFQSAVEKYLIRHQSVLDVISKYQEASARVNRAIAKSVTTCGCLKIKAEKQKIPQGVKYHDLKQYMDNHINGSLCSACKEIIESELGTSLFYLTAICNLLNLDLYRVMKQEQERISALGIYSLE